jgi:multidrug efflux pump subunit AcrB
MAEDNEARGPSQAGPESLVRGALRRPITVMVAVAAVVFLAAFALLRTLKRDILPDLGLPAIYVAQPYGGMSPAQMEGFLTYYYEYHFFYINGIESIESQNIQGVSLMKLKFHPGTDMSAAMAETVSQVDRSKAFMPPGTVPPFILRFDAGNVPVGYLAFESPSRNLGELQDLALNRVRPMFASLAGVSSPPPFGASLRTILVNLKPDKLRLYHISPDQLAKAIALSNAVTPSGNILLGDKYPMVPMNSVVHGIQELLDVPVRLATFPTVFLGDVATVTDGADLQSGYALVDGKPTVYIPVTKRADASTLDVVDEVKASMAKFQQLLPEDTKVKFVFDQSVYVREAIKTVISEGALGAVLTGLMVLLFLGDPRSALIVVANIPFALLGACVGLWLTGQTINLMTLGGLALAVGILVDEATVTIENIHSHMERGEGLAHASLRATEETTLPRFLNMICILAVFIPSFVMQGAARALFIPLALAVGFSMVFSYFLSTTFVPVMSVWTLKEEKGHGGPLDRILGAVRTVYAAVLERLMPLKKTLVACYIVVMLGLLALMLGRMGREIFPRFNTNQFVIRLRAPAGTYFTKTAEIAKQALDIIDREAGGLRISVGYAGLQSPDFAINNIYQWSSGYEEARLTVEMLKSPKEGIGEFEERLRGKLRSGLPDVRVSFAPADLMGQVMNMGAAAPIEVAASGPDYQKDTAYAQKIKEALDRIGTLRDVQIEQDVETPAVRVTVDRRKAGVLGATVRSLGDALTSATSSSRYVLPIFWEDEAHGVGYQIQAEVPLNKMTSISDIKNIGVDTTFHASIPLERLASVISTTTVGEFDRYNMQRMVSVTANVYQEDLGHAAKKVEAALKALEPERPRGVFVSVRGQVPPMENMFSGLAVGLGMAIVVIFLLMGANFQSMKVAFVIMTSVPAVLCGAAALLMAMGSTLNIQSFMGTIMSVGVAIANAIILVSFAEQYRLAGERPAQAALHAAQSRLRPILMTAGAMIAGMVPMASGLEESAKAMAPLAQAVIGGLTLATLATLAVLPLAYAAFQTAGPGETGSLDPDDPHGRHYEKEKEGRP